MPRRRRPHDAWNRFSPSKMSSPCKLRTYRESILRVDAPDNPWAARGKAVHYFFKLFLTRHPSTQRFPFEKFDDFRRVFAKFWFDAVEGRHGFDGRSRPPTKVEWESSQQPGALYGDSVKMLARFHDTYRALRDDEMIRLPERRFTFTQEGITWTGIIDLIEATPEGAVIIDHKDRYLSPQEVKAGLQFTFYQHGYYRFFAPRLAELWHCRPPPLQRMFVHNYREGAWQPIPLRSDDELGRLQHYLARDHAYFKGVLTDVDPHLEYGPTLRSTELEDIAIGDISPLLPRGQHCQYCRHLVPCLDWERNRQTMTAREQFVAHHGGTLDPRAAPQPRLPLAEQPAARAGRAAYRGLVQQLAAAGSQPLLGFDLPPARPVKKPFLPRRKKPHKP